MSAVIRALIVDDEELARERIRTLLAGDDQIQIVDECADGRSAVAAIRRRKPDLLFLDVQMPELDGFAVLEEVGAVNIPAIVFVTAYDRYAIRAFEFVALDYLLKPFDSSRFRQTLDRAKEQIRVRGADMRQQQIEALLENASRPHLERLVVRESGRISFLRVEEIRWLEAQGNYVKIHASGQAPVIRRTLKDLEERLDPSRFLRIHRSILVNLDRVRELRPMFHGEYQVLLDDGTELTSNRGLKETLRRVMDDRF